jgi:hypothetical protein
MHAGASAAHHSNVMMPPTITQHKTGSGDDILQQRSANKRRNTLEVTLDQQRESLQPIDTPTVKRGRQTPVGPVLSHQQQSLDAGHTACARLPLFKPSETLELFAPSIKLDPGKSWIITWL